MLKTVWFWALACTVVFVAWCCLYNGQEVKAAEPSISGETLDALSKAALIINARVRLEPEDLEATVRDVLNSVSGGMDIETEIDDLQCFSPAYPEPPHVIRESLE